MPGQAPEPAFSRGRGRVEGRGGFLSKGGPPNSEVPPDHHLRPPPGLKRGVCVKINHFPEDTDYDHDSAEYLLRTLGSGTDWGDRGAWHGWGVQLNRRAEKSVPANPSLDIEIPCSRTGLVVSLPPAPLTSGRAEWRSWELIGGSEVALCAGIGRCALGL